MTNCRPTRTARPIGLAFAALWCSSCGQKSEVVPVRGQVFYNGKPTPGAVVVFHVVGGDPKSPTRTPMPIGTVQSDGSFTLKTYPLGDGAPPGEYRVAIAWLDNSRMSEDGVVPNRLPGRYGNPQTSGLTVRVNAGPTELPPFQLIK